MIEIDISEFTSKIKSRTEAINYVSSLGKILFYYTKGYILPKEAVFNVEFVYQFIANKKKLLLKEHDYEVYMPNYATIPELQKRHLLDYCYSKNELKMYLPDSDNCQSIERDTLLKVRNILNIHNR